MSILNPNKSTQSKQEQFRRLVIIAGYYGFDNLGDELILEELLNELSSLFTRDNIVVLSQTPDKTASLYAVKSISRWHWLAYMHALRQAKLLISGGGGLFQDRTGFGSVIFYSAQIMLARICGTKVLIYAQGLGPLRKIFSNVLTRFACQQAGKITVRDHNSLAMVQKWGLSAQLTADPVWSLQPSPLPASVQTMLPDAKGIIVGLSLREDPLLQNYHLEILAKSIAQALPAQSNILLIPMQIERDQQPLKTFAQFLASYGLCATWLDSAMFTKPSQWLALMAQCDLVIGMRFHALLMALKSSKPVIGITYDQKVSQLLQDFEQPALSLDLEKEECQIVWPTTINNGVESREDLSNKVKKKLVPIRQLADKNMIALADILEVDTTGNVTSIRH